jgi:hypothetical protein
MMCMIIVSCYVPSVMVDVYLTRFDEITERTYKILRSVEKQRAKAFDRQYRHEKLNAGFVPLFYPNLIRSADGTYTKIAKEYDVAPLAPQPNESLYYCNEGYGLISYKSDRYGFRNSDFVWDKGDKTFLIGDSFTHGACIPNQNQTIAGYLSNSTNAINLGTVSNGPIHYAAIAKAIVSHFDSENVVMVFYPNDNSLRKEDNAESYFYNYYWHENKKPYLTKQGDDYILNPDLVTFYESINDLLQPKLKSHNADMSADAEAQKIYNFTADEVRDYVIKNLRFVDFFSIDNLKLEKLRPIFVQFIKRKKTDFPFSTLLAIDELATVCEDRCNAVVVYIPNSELWRPDGRAASYRRGLAEYTRNKGITFVDTTDRLRMLTDSEAYAVKGPHLSPKGYQVVSEAILEVIKM